MVEDHRVLTPSEAQAYYNQFGSKQDDQGFYEDPPLEDLVRHAGFQDADAVFEFGCGTGKFAARLLADVLSDSATYLGCDITPIMVGLAAHRLAPYSGRAAVVQSHGTARFPLADRSVDRVVSTYVLDLLPAAGIHAVFAEAHRVLRPGGRLCLASLTHGRTLPSHVVSSLWMAVFRARPSAVGGCRPIHLGEYIDPGRWHTAHRRVLAPFGVPSEVLILSAVDGP